MFRKMLEALLGRAQAKTLNDLREPDAAAVIEQINASAQPCVHVLHSGEARNSKLGGAPTVPPHFEWPRWNDAPLQFLCQIDLDELHMASPQGWLPKQGLLSFFYDAEQSTWGFDPSDRGSWRVIHVPPSAGLEPANLPPETGPGQTLPEVFVRFESGISLPEPERLGLKWGKVSEDVWDYVHERRGNGVPNHQIGGFPCPIQNDNMELECQLASNGIYVGNAEGYASDKAKALGEESTEWRLLLQLDSDDDAGTMWGDVGRLYFWVRESDAAVGDFSGVWMVLQCS